MNGGSAEERPKPPDSPAAGGTIRIRGARVHNLQNVDLDVPRGRLVVFTGVSGSGKSSLAFDTIFAEGQRQFLETLSVYARRRIDQLERPDVDAVEGLPPTICVDQRAGTANARSTVGTITEIYDYLRLLFARTGAPHCHRCGAAIRQQSSRDIEKALAGLPEETRLMLLAPMVRRRRGDHADVILRIRKAGLVRARFDGEIHDIEAPPELSPAAEHTIEAVVDRIVVRETGLTRLAESIDLALRLGEGRLVASWQLPQVDTWREERFSTLYLCPDCGASLAEVEPRTFSFNSPYGACPACGGLGRVEAFEPGLVIPDMSLSLADGAIAAWKGVKTAVAREHRTQADAFLSAAGGSPETPLAEIPPRLVELLLHGEGDFLGVITLLEKELATATNKKRQKELAALRDRVACRQCRGSRLRAEAHSVRLGGYSIAEIAALPAGEAIECLTRLEFTEAHSAVARPIIEEIVSRLRFLEEVGAGYLSLDRSGETLSGGELQRVRLATGIGTGLVGVCYVLDEPSIGLHPVDNQRLIDAIRRLQRQGNSVLVVEHDEEMIRQADHVIDVGPGAGPHGGRVVAAGPPGELDQSDSLTARFLRGTETISVPARRRRTAKSRCIVLDGATTNNLKNVSVRFPLGALVCVTGVSGSGKSSLINETLAPALLRRMGRAAPRPGPHGGLRGVSQIEQVVIVDQSPIGRTPRSSAATFVGAFDEIRKVFAATRAARRRGFRAARFSFNNNAGRCPVCRGQGIERIEMNFLPDIFVTCQSCRGARFNRQTLSVTFRGQSIADILAMPVAEAREFFAGFAALEKLLAGLDDVGLGYLPLGQPATALSGGEAQRVKLAAELARPGGSTLYLLDEPTTGLHLADVRRLLGVIGRLVDAENSVIVIEHHLDVIKSADWIIDLGPGGGAGGGEIVAEGTPEEVAMCEQSRTGQFLRSVLRPASDRVGRE